MTTITPDPTLSAIPAAPHYLAIYDGAESCWTVGYGMERGGHAYVCGIFIGPDGERFAKEIANFLNQLERSPAFSCHFRPPIYPRGEVPAINVALADASEISRLRAAIMRLGMMAAGATGGNEESRVLREIQDAAHEVLEGES